LAPPVLRAIISQFRKYQKNAAKGKNLIASPFARRSFPEQAIKPAHKVP
jgi:hypothetical protein